MGLIPTTEVFYECLLTFYFLLLTWSEATVISQLTDNTLMVQVATFHREAIQNRITKAK